MHIGGKMVIAVIVECHRKFVYLITSIKYNIIFFFSL